MMKLEQRANIKFCFKLGKTFTETYNLMKQVYGDNCLSRTRVYEWFKRFQEGREDIRDDDHPGPQNTVVTQRNIEQVREFIKKEPTSTLRYMSMQLNLSRNSIHRILTDHLHLRKVPHKLIDYEKSMQTQRCKDLKESKRDPNTKYSIAIGDESPCSDTEKISMAPVQR